MIQFRVIFDLQKFSFSNFLNHFFENFTKNQVFFDQKNWFFFDKIHNYSSQFLTQHTHLPHPQNPPTMAAPDAPGPVKLTPEQQERLRTGGFLEEDRHILGAGCGCDPSRPSHRSGCVRLQALAPIERRCRPSAFSARRGVFAEPRAEGRDPAVRVGDGGVRGFEGAF